MKSFITALLASLALSGCAYHGTPTPYRVTDPCLETIVNATYSGYKSDQAGLGVVALKALQLNDVAPNSANLDALGEQCAAHPEFSFIQAATAVRDAGK